MDCSRLLLFDWLSENVLTIYSVCFFFFFFHISITETYLSISIQQKTLHVFLKTGNNTGIMHLPPQNKLRSHLQTGNRRLEIYCNGLGSLVVVAVYIGMHNGDGWNYSESSIALWYERTYWCEAFRNSKIYNLVN